MIGDDNVRDALRMLLASTPRAAPERVEIALISAFRKQAHSRRLRRRAVAASIATAACIAVSFSLWKPLIVNTAVTAPPAPVISLIAPPPDAWTVAPWAPLPRPRRTVARVSGLRPRPQVHAQEFVLLPYGDPALVDDSATIVRVDLPGSALRLAGFNVPQDIASNRVQADVLLGADGLAHAVRLVSFQQ